MDHHLLVAALGAVSVVFALEGVWLENRVGKARFFAGYPGIVGRIIVRGLYFLGLPYVALISGLIPARFFGLKGLELLVIDGPAATLSGVGAMVFTWISDFSSLIFIGFMLGLVFLFYLMRVLNMSFKDGLVSRLPGVGALFDGVHWGFYRAALWLLAGSLYLGVVGGIAIVLIEYIAASRMAYNNHQQQYLLRFALGMVTSITFLFAPNLWLILGLHLVLTMLVNGLLKYTHMTMSSQPVGT